MSARRMEGAGRGGARQEAARRAPAPAPAVTVTLFDYGAGNMHSIARALAAFPGADVSVTADPRAALAGDLLVLPGVGAFQAAAARLAPGREAMRVALLSGLPCVGICLGMQLLFESSEEGPGAGLGMIAGRVTALDARRAPHIGWNTLEPADGEDEGALPAAVYFANGFACRPAGAGARVRAWTRHEADRFPAIVQSHRAIGVQFHPEKSGAAGIAFLHACMREVLCG